MKRIILKILVIVSFLLVVGGLTTVFLTAGCSDFGSLEDGRELLRRLAIGTSIALIGMGGLSVLHDLKS